MHNFGDSFGFRRSDEILHSGAEANLKVPATGTFLQGDVVELDPANPGYVKKSAANAPLVPGIRGLLVQYGELRNEPGLTRNVIHNTRDLSAVVNDAQTVVVTGAGIKVWVKNLAQVTAGSGRRAYAAEDRITLASLVLGDLVAWTGTKFARTTDAAAAIGTVTKVTATGAEFTLNN
jgi:hypothetical protein